MYHFLYKIQTNPLVYDRFCREKQVVLIEVSKVILCLSITLYNLYFLISTFIETIHLPHPYLFFQLVVSLFFCFQTSFLCFVSIHILRLTLQYINNAQYDEEVVLFEKKVGAVKWDMVQHNFINKQSVF